MNSDILLMFDYDECGSHFGRSDANNPFNFVAFCRKNVGALFFVGHNCQISLFLFFNQNQIKFTTNLTKNKK